MQPADEVKNPMNTSVVVKFGIDPTDKPDAAAFLDFDEAPGWEAKALGVELVGLAREIGPDTRYDLSVQESHFSWGADASMAEAAIYVGCAAVKYMTALAVEETVRHTFKRIVANSGGHVEPLTREVAASLAQQRVAVSFDESAEGLAVTAEEEVDPGTAWAISFRSKSSGDLYRVSVVRMKTRAIRTLVTRTRSDAEQVTNLGTNRAG